MYSTCPVTAIQRGIRAFTATKHDHTTRHTQDCKMVQQLCIDAKNEWESQAMSRSSKTKPSSSMICRGPTLNDVFPK